MTSYNPRNQEKTNNLIKFDKKMNSDSTKTYLQTKVGFKLTVIHPYHQAHYKPLIEVLAQMSKLLILSCRVRLQMLFVRYVRLVIMLKHKLLWVFAILGMSLSVLAMPLTIMN